MRPVLLVERTVAFVVQRLVCGFCTQTVLPGDSGGRVLNLTGSAGGARCVEAACQRLELMSGS